MDEIKTDAERILKDAVTLLSKVNRNQASNPEIEVVLRDIIGVCQKLLSDEQDALKRISMDFQRLFGNQKKAESALERAGLDFKKLFS